LLLHLVSDIIAKCQGSILQLRFYDFSEEVLKRPV